MAIIGIILAILIGEPVRFIDNHNYMKLLKILDAKEIKEWLPCGSMMGGVMM